MARMPFLMLLTACFITESASPSLGWACKRSFWANEESLAGSKVSAFETILEIVGRVGVIMMISVDPSILQHPSIPNCPRLLGARRTLNTQIAPFGAIDHPFRNEPSGRLNTTIRSTRILRYFNLTPQALACLLYILNMLT